MKMNNEQVKAMRQKVMATDDKVYNTRTYQYWINGSGELCRAKRSDLDTMAMYEEGAIEILE